MRNSPMPPKMTALPSFEAHPQLTTPNSSHPQTTVQANFRSSKSAFQELMSALLADPEITDLCLVAQQADIEASIGDANFHDKESLFIEISAEGNAAWFPDKGGMVRLSSPVLQSRFPDIQVNLALSSENLKSWCLETLTRAGKSWDARHPFVDLSLPSGHRAHFAFPPIARSGLMVSIRRGPSQSPVSLSSWGAVWALQLEQWVVQKRTLLISGSTGSGKTTLMNALLERIPPTQRILTLEDTPELAPHHPQVFSLVSRPANSDGQGEVSLRSLLKQCLRMRPDRIILGECRGNEVMDLLQVLNTGHSGSLATLHANSARDAVRRLELLCLLASDGKISLSVLRDLIANGVDYLIHLERDSDGVRRIREVLRIAGKEGDTLLFAPISIQDTLSERNTNSMPFTRSLDPFRTERS